jgi:hypothetical protein
MTGHVSDNMDTLIEFSEVSKIFFFPTSMCRINNFRLILEILTCPALLISHVLCLMNKLGCQYTVLLPETEQKQHQLFGLRPGQSRTQSLLK